jgi:hypothetical protein
MTVKSRKEAVQASNVPVNRTSTLASLSFARSSSLTNPTISTDISS